MYSSSHSLLFPREDHFRLIWLLLYLKPPRLKKPRTEMKPKIQKKTPARRCRLLLHCLKTLVQIRRGSMSTRWLLRVPLHKRLLLLLPLCLEEGVEMFDLMDS
jgi:hypothetical protein